MNNHQIYLNVAREIAKMSKCIQIQVGAIIVKDGRILSTGYNGTPKGFVNCNQFFNFEKPERSVHHEFSEMYEIHAEQNAILFAAKYGISIDQSDLYTTLHPCNDCLKIICNSGIKNIYYCDEYDKFVSDLKINTLLEKCNVKLIKVDKNDK